MGFMDTFTRKRVRDGGLERVERAKRLIEAGGNDIGPNTFGLLEFLQILKLAGVFNINVPDISEDDLAKAELKVSRSTGKPL
jgi:hypothetical protein